jgi:CHAT domain-containing protein
MKWRRLRVRTEIGQILAIAVLGLLLVVGSAPAVARSAPAVVPCADVPLVSGRSAIEQARAQFDLGLCYQKVGQYELAIGTLKQAGKQFQAISGQTIPLLETLVNLGNTYELIGDYDQASAYYQQVLDYAKAKRDRRVGALALKSLGGISINTGDNESAIQYLTQAIKFEQRLGDRSRESLSQYNLGLAHYFNQDFNQAQKHLKLALELAQANRNLDLEAFIQTTLGVTSTDQKQYPQAIIQHQAAIAIAQKLNQPRLIAHTLNNYSHTLMESGDLVQAEKTMRQSIARLEGLRSGVQADGNKVSLFDTKRFAYNLLQQILIASQQPERALEVAEQGRSRAFAEQLAGTQGLQSVNLPSINLAQIQQIAKSENATLVEYSLVADEAFRFRGKLQGKAESVMIWVVQPSGKVTYRQVDLRSRAKTQGTLTQMVAAARCLNPVPKCPALADLIKNQRSVKNQRGGSGTSQSTSQSTPQSTPQSVSQPQSKPTPQERQLPISALSYPGLPELYEVLIQPIADLLPTAVNEKVIFLPQDELFLVPFAALPNAQGEYLIKQHTIVTLPSIQVLNLTRRNADRSNPRTWRSEQLLIAGNPKPMPESMDSLPYAEQEALKIAQQFQVKPLIGAAMTRQAVIDRAAKAKLIHLATHGLLGYGQNNALDIPGAIALTPTAGDSGFLTAMEIAKLKLNADLVVLSACDTGRGTISGDGVLGLSRSWMVAGAKNVLVSLWAVNDTSTSVLMEQFYGALAVESDPALALRSAILKTMEQYPSPYDWAAFTLMGAGWR